MIDLCTQVSSYLTTQITSLVIGRNLQAGILPNSPVVVTAVIPTGGPFLPFDSMRYRQFQILHRNTVLSSAMALVNSIWASLDNVYNPFGCDTGRIFPNHEPGPMWRDANMQFIYSLNFTHEIPKV